MATERIHRTTLTAKEVADYLGISYWLITQLVKRKQIIEKNLLLNTEDKEKIREENIKFSSIRLIKEILLNVNIVIKNYIESYYNGTYMKQKGLLRAITKDGIALKQNNIG